MRVLVVTVLAACGSTPPPAPHLTDADARFCGALGALVDAGSDRTLFESVRGDPIPRRNPETRGFHVTVVLPGATRCELDVHRDTVAGLTCTMLVTQDALAAHAELTRLTDTVSRCLVAPAWASDTFEDQTSWRARAPHHPVVTVSLGAHQTTHTVSVTLGV